MEIGKHLSDYFDSKGVTQVDIASQLGVSKAYVNALFTGRSRFGRKQAELWAEKFGLSKAWLLTGEGEMLNDAPQPVEDVEVDEAEAKPFRTYFKENKPVPIPLINIDSVGGAHSSNILTIDEQYIMRMIILPDSREGDVAILQSGDSMYPTISPGAILQIRQVIDWQEYFGYGNVFVLLLRDGRRITKQVLKYGPDPRNFVTCHSFNENADDEELPKRMIRQVWKVINVLTNTGW